MLCRVAALKVSPYITIMQIIFSFLFISDQRGYSEKSEMHYGISLDSFSNQRLIYLLYLGNTSLCIDFPGESCKITVFFFKSKGSLKLLK